MHVLLSQRQSTQLCYIELYNLDFSLGVLEWIHIDHILTCVFTYVRYVHTHTYLSHTYVYVHTRIYSTWEGKLLVNQLAWPIVAGLG